jgi:hypothetical protein
MANLLETDAVTFDRVLRQFELSDVAAGQLLGCSANRISAMRAGHEPLPFLITLAVSAMYRSDIGYQHALDHMMAATTGSVTLQDLLSFGHRRSVSQPETNDGLEAKLNDIKPFPSFKVYRGGKSDG